MSRTKKLAYITNRNVTLIQMLDVVALVVAIYFISQSTLDNKISIGSMVMFYQGFLKAQTTLSQLFVSGISIYHRRLYFADFLGYMNTPERKETSTKKAAYYENLDKGLVINQLNFCISPK